MKIIFFGNADFGIPTLNKILSSKKHSLIEVVTNPDKKSGRGNIKSSTPIKKWATDKNVKVVEIDNLKNQNFINHLNKSGADLFMVIAYKIISPNIFNIPDFGTMNLHASLLPKYRGAAPIQRVILEGKKHTGITTFIINRKIDKGKIILQEKISISNNDNYTLLYKKLSNAGADLVANSLDYLIDKKPLKNQNEKSTYAKKINKNDLQIIWREKSKTIVNKIRAFSFHPGAYTNFNEKRIKILEAEIVDIDCNNILPGEVKVLNNFLYVKAKDGLVKINSLKPEGKQVISSHDFINGYLDSKKKILEFEYI